MNCHVSFIMLRILKKFASLLRSRIIFLTPKKRPILLYDSHGNSLAKKIFKPGMYEILHTRKETLNLPILLTTLLKGKFSALEYFKNYVNFVSPEIVITFNDNSFNFYELKKKCREHFISVQRGYRTYHNDILEYFKNKNETFHIDHYFVFNKSIINHLKKYVISNYTLLGSAENNFYSINNLTKKKREIVYISSHSIAGFEKLNETDQMISEFYQIEIKVLNSLIDFCEKNNYILSILGKHRVAENKIIEKDFFINNLKGNFNYIENNYERKTYEILDRASMSIGTHSTLIYENFSRGNKSFVFNFRHDKYPFNTKRFGYFSNLSDSGEIWYAGKNINIFLDKIIKILNAKETDWKQILKKYENDTCYFNYGNAILKKYLKQKLSKKIDSKIIYE